MVKKVYYDDKSEMTVCFTDTNTFIFEITDSEDPNSIIFQNVELTTEDVEDLINHLQYYLDNQNPLPKFSGIDNEAVKEAHYYSQQKRLLEESMKEYIASIKPTQHIEKELKTIELDPLNREVEVTKTKLKENVKRK